MASQNSIFRQQQQLYRSSHYFGKPKSPPIYQQPQVHEQEQSHNGSSRKRRASEDEDMMGNESHMAFESTNTIARSPDSSISPKVPESQSWPKRNRTGIEKQFPLRKLLGTMDKDKLIELISDLVDSNPQLQADVDDILATGRTKET